MNHWVDYISYLSIYIPALAGIFYFRKTSNLIRIIILYIWTTAFLEIGVDFLKQRSINNLFLFHIHTFIEFGFLIVIYGNLIRHHKKAQILNFLAFIFLVSSILLILFYQDFTQFNSVQRHIEGFIITLIVFFYLIERSMRVQRFTNTPMEIMSWALLIYFGGNLYVFALGDKILTTGSGSLWAVHGVLNILLNLVFAYVIIKNRATRHVKS